MDTVHRLSGIEFEWNPDKAEINLAKHGVSFPEAAEVFLDPLCALGDGSDAYEQREYAIGYSYSQRLMFVVHVERGIRIRVISARLATQLEKRIYEST
jgi:uncharacterized protein